MKTLQEKLQPIEDARMKAFNSGDEELFNQLGEEGLKIEIEHRKQLLERAFRTINVNDLKNALTMYLEAVRTKLNISSEQSDDIALYIAETIHQGLDWEKELMKDAEADAMTKDLF